MSSVFMEKQKTHYSLGKRIGLGIIQILIMLVAIGLVYKTIFIAKKTPKQSSQQTLYFNAGYADGLKRIEGRQLKALYVPPGDIVLKNSYLKGYRKGWDDANRM